MRILVCGDRNFTDRKLMCEVIRRNFNPADVLIHGCARGADQLSEEVLNDYLTIGYLPEIVRYPADWDKHGKGAGYIRNKQMLVEGKPDKVIAFLAPNSKGTANMIKQAQEAGVPVEVINV